MHALSARLCFEPVGVPEADASRKEKHTKELLVSSRETEASGFFPQEFAGPHLRRILIILRRVSVPYVHTYHM
jgi:hypothetical protein